MKDIRTAPAAEPAGAPAQRESPPCRILVVDDDSDIRRINTEMLTRSGYQVDAAEDGAAGWEALGACNYDLLITDNNMPRVTGLELIEKLHSTRMAVPVIMATGTLPATEFARQPWLEPAATLLKPYTAEQMLRTVKKVLCVAGSATAGSRPTVDGAMKDHKIPQTEEVAGALRQGPMNSPHRILAVDGDRNVRLLYTDALAGPDCRVDVADDGAAGWEALQAHSYNLLITEHDMPGLTGVGLVRKLRAAHMALPVVMASGRLPVEELARSPSLRLAAILLKPFALDALRDTVKNVLRATDNPLDQTDPLPDWRSLPSASDLQL